MSTENKYLLDLGRAAQREVLLHGLKQSVKVSTFGIMLISFYVFWETTQTTKYRK